MCIVVAALAIVVEVVVHRAGPTLKGRITETLSARFNARVELGSLNVSVLRGLGVSGKQLLICPPDPIIAAGATQPLIAIEHFSFHSGIAGFFASPWGIPALPPVARSSTSKVKAMSSTSMWTFRRASNRTSWNWP